MHKDNYSFSEDCDSAPIETAVMGIRVLGFPDAERNIEEHPCMSADGEVILSATDEGGKRIGVHAMKLRGVGLFITYDADQARSAGLSLIKMADDLEKDNAQTMVP